jgi:hypothetical protein
LYFFGIQPLIRTCYSSFFKAIVVSSGFNIVWVVFKTATKPKNVSNKRERERAQFTDQIEALREQAERQSADHRQALAALTDQRKKNLWARLIG